MKRILVIDDDLETCRFLSEIFTDEGWTVESAQTPARALTVARGSNFDLIVSDINLNAEIDGLALLRTFKQELPNTDIILITGFGTLEKAVESVQEGAFDFISKPFNVQEVIQTVRRALDQQKAAPAAREGQQQISLEHSAMVGRSRKMIELYREIARVIPSSSTVLVMGESGTGKEVVARFIHQRSPRSKNAFVAVNCGALTETLLESELFGHMKGSFTGAIADKKGLFEEADDGTIFLDEVGEMSPALQVKLLRTLQEGEVRRVGGNRPIKVSVRVIAATNRNLEQEVKEKRFREDLYYRLSVVTLVVPPLRERREDIPLLAAHFIEQSFQRTHVRRTIADDTMTILMAYDWPGNVRELENTIEHALLYARGNVITPADLPEKFWSLKPAKIPKAQNKLVEMFQDLPSLDELERRYLIYVLESVRGNRTRAAEIMQIDRRTLYRMAERHGIRMEEADE
ncbi:MAG TPA: sigma-54 dependent transcriptional regulator [Blastocatellia bacterium]|nr:sigma-54 dependent transcriptional regulator [Blastocatellia bacterium]